jgi:hypothetical protein
MRRARHGVDIRAALSLEAHDDGSAADRLGERAMLVFEADLADDRPLRYAPSAQHRVSANRAHSNCPSTLQQPSMHGAEVCVSVEASQSQHRGDSLLVV